MWIDMRRVVFSQGNAGSRCVREGKGTGIEGKDSKCVLGCAVDVVLHAMSCHAGARLHCREAMGAALRPSLC